MRLAKDQEPYSNNLITHIHHNHQMSGSKSVIFVGAADAICREAVRLFASASTMPIILAGSSEDDLRQVASQLPAQRVTLRVVDIFNAQQLRDAIAGAALVVQGAQPYHRASGPVMAACIDAKVPYLDYSDDVSSTRESLGLQERAKKHGVPCYINCGSSPGMSNLMAAQICAELTTVESIDICWLVSEEGGELGREVLEHLMHITAGDCPTWAEGEAQVHENWVERADMPFEPAPEPSVLFHESIHPEPITLPRRFPKVQRIRAMGALNPAPYNGFARGLGAAVHTGGLSMDAAVDFLTGLQKTAAGGGWKDTVNTTGRRLSFLGSATLKDLFQMASHGLTSLKPWRFALSGMLEQIRNGECTTTDAIQFLVNASRGKKAPHKAGMIVRGVGTGKDGRPAVVVKRASDGLPFSVAQGSMATMIGASCAAFVLQVLELQEVGGQSPGVYCPEDWTTLGAFYNNFTRVLQAAEEIRAAQN